MHFAELESEIHDAAEFVSSHMIAGVMRRRERGGVVARWVKARLEGKEDREARRQALVGMPIWASILATVIFKILVRWWEQRDK